MIAVCALSSNCKRFKLTFCYTIQSSFSFRYFGFNLLIFFVKTSFVIVDRFKVSCLQFIFVSNKCFFLFTTAKLLLLACILSISCTQNICHVWVYFFFLSPQFPKYFFACPACTCTNAKVTF